MGPHCDLLWAPCPLLLWPWVLLKALLWALQWALLWALLWGFLWVLLCAPMAPLWTLLQALP